jgi:hypothetical protein
MSARAFLAKSGPSASGWSQASGDCQDFRVRAMTMGRKEPSHGTTQNPGDR